MPRTILTYSAVSALCFFLLPLAAAAHTPPVAPPDSIGVLVRQSKTFVRHRVAAGETLYGLARRYNVKVEQIMEANPSIKGELKKGTEVLIPRIRAVVPAGSGAATTPKTTAPAAASAAIKALSTDADGNRVYKVQAGQSLFAIARKFDVSPSALQRYNSKQLPASGAVRVGQTLIIVPAGGGAPAKATPPPAVATTPKSTPAPTGRPERDDEAEKERAREAEREKERAAKEAAAAAPTTTSPVATTEDDDKEPTRANEIVRKVTESGVAAVIDGGNSEKYLALHKTAPVGTIMMVRNIMNGRVVYVRVIGKLPDTGDNASVLLRLSKRAVAVLGTPDQRFRVETSYLPE